VLIHRSPRDEATSMASACPLRAGCQPWSLT
jgi:hypothetical protein